MNKCLKVVALVGIGIAFGSLAGSFALLKFTDCYKDWPGKADMALVTSAWRAYEERDLDGAHEMCEKASQEHPRIQYIMGRYEELRTGDFDEAAHWYLKSAEQGFCPAMVSLSECFRLGRGREKNGERSVYWAERAAEDGDIHSCLTVASAYASGHDVPRDASRAFKWWLVAANADNRDAQYQTGRAYEFGIGIRRDIDDAAKWYDRARINGHPLAAEGLTRIRSEKRQEMWGRFKDRLGMLFAI